MNNSESDEPKLESLSLEPITSTGKAVFGAKPAKFQIDTRGRGDRRTSADRRQVIRFEEDRRQGDRRAKANPWEGGTIL